MSQNKLFVANIAFSVSDDSLRDHFATIGNVLSARVICDRDTGRSRGFGFVEMETDELAQQAISMLHEKEFDGRELTISVAKPRT